MSDDIGKLADEVISRRKTTEELRHVPYEMYARVLARAERAEAKVAELEAALADARNELLIEKDRKTWP